MVQHPSQLDARDAADKQGKELQVDGHSSSPYSSRTDSAEAGFGQPRKRSPSVPVVGEVDRNCPARKARVGGGGGHRPPEPAVVGEEPTEGDPDPDRRGTRLSAVPASPGQYAGKGEEAPVLHRIGHLRVGARLDLLARDENGKPAVAAKDQAAALVDRVCDDAVLGPALRALSHAGA